MLHRLFHKADHSMLSSQLYDNRTFYQALEQDLNGCKYEAIIESPFITANRVDSLLPIFRKMRSRGIRLVINTKPIHEHAEPYASQAQSAIDVLQEIGVEILFTGKHHRKLAILDKKVTWEGSLNILSQNDSCEIMRRIESVDLAEEVISFIKINKFL